MYITHSYPYHRNAQTSITSSVWFAYSTHKTRDKAETALEDYFANGEICESEHPYIEKASGPVVRNVSRCMRHCGRCFYQEASSGVPETEQWEIEMTNLSEAIQLAHAADAVFEASVKAHGYKSRWDMTMEPIQSQSLRDAYFAKIDADKAMGKAFAATRDKLA